MSHSMQISVVNFIENMFKVDISHIQQFGFCALLMESDCKTLDLAGFETNPKPSSAASQHQFTNKVCYPLQSQMFHITPILLISISSTVLSHNHGHGGNCLFDELLDYEIEHEEGFNESLSQLEEFYTDFNFHEIWEIDEDWDSENTTSRLINDEVLRRRLLEHLKVDTSKFFAGILEIPVIVHVLYNPNYVYHGRVGIILLI